MLSRVHTCFSQHLGESLPPRRCAEKCNRRRCFRDCRARGVECLCRRCTCVKCHCKQQVSLAAARKEIEEGHAQWVIVKKNPETVSKVCPLCGDDEILKRSCANCFHTGIVPEVIYTAVVSTDIVVSSAVEIREDNRGVKHEVSRSAVAKRTPRVATIEKAHMERAYPFGGNAEERERIEVYGELNKEFFDSLMAPFQKDPTGGRLIFCFSPDERSVAVHWSQGAAYAPDTFKSQMKGIK